MRRNPETWRCDGSDGNSPYTKALANTMRRPGLDIFRMFNEVGLAQGNSLNESKLLNNSE